MDNEPPEEFYRRRILEEAATGEPELLLLSNLIKRGGTAVDVGAHQGFFSFALSEVVDQVHAFEPHPAYAEFALRMLKDRANVHNVALSDNRGQASFFVPVSDDGAELHMAGNLKNTHTQFQKQKVIEVKVETLDAYDLRDVRFIKVDVEGSEVEVLMGGRSTIMRDRPVMLLELLSGTYENPIEVTKEVCETFGYHAYVTHNGELLDAVEAIEGLNSNTTWGSHITTRNVLFISR
jgi:FkbM family methyltransferase